MKGNRVIIHLQENSIPNIEEYCNGIKVGEGQMKLDLLIKALMDSTESPGVRTPILPKGTLFYSESSENIYCYLEVPPHSRKALYHQAIIEDVPFPRLVFGYHLFKRDDKLYISQVKVAALENLSFCNEDSPVYIYPYTNVNSNFSVCWGLQDLPAIDRISQLSTISELFFNSPNSDCYYSNSNSSKLGYRQLVESIKGESFPDYYLIHTGYTLENWIIRQTLSI